MVKNHYTCGNEGKKIETFPAKKLIALNWWEIDETYCWEDVRISTSHFQSHFMTSESSMSGFRRKSYFPYFTELCTPFSTLPSKDLHHEHGTFLLPMAPFFCPRRLRQYTHLSLSVSLWAWPSVLRSWVTQSKTEVFALQCFLPTKRLI